MELGATMELRGGRGGQLEEEDTPYIVEEQIQPLSTNSACAARYYRRAPRYYRPHSRDQNSLKCTKVEGGSTAGAVLPLPLAVLPQGRAGAVQGWEGTDIKITSVATSAELESMQKPDAVVP